MVELINDHLIIPILLILMDKKFPLILTLLIAVFLLLYYTENVYELISKTYVVDETELYKVDTFHLFRRAFESSDLGGRGSSKPKLIFESFDNCSFAIGGNIFQAITEKEKLEDTLMYHGTKFTVFTDKQTYDEYKKGKRPIFIKVYQIEIGNVKYIDIPKLNKISKANLLGTVIVPPLIILFTLFLISKRVEWYTSWKVILWGITLILTMAGLGFLIVKITY
jgi:hypothetical protein